jgi:hypothetical protein
MHGDKMKTQAQLTRVGAQQPTDKGIFSRRKAITESRVGRRHWKPEVGNTLLRFVKIFFATRFAKI